MSTTDRENTENLQRITIPAMDMILGAPFGVLDKGFIRVVDYMGGDDSVVRAARVSYGKGTKKVSEDRGLIRYLMRHHHETPFEMAQIQMHIRIPMDAWRQFVRHRTLSINEYSTRYSEAIDDKQATTSSQWRSQDTSNKQGSGDYLPEEKGLYLTGREQDFHVAAKELYQERLEAGVAREQARKDLPLSTYTEAYVCVDLRNLLHFLALRMDAHAQKEIREYATIIGQQIVSKWVPWTWEAFLDYRLNATSLSQNETKALGVILRAGKPLELTNQFMAFGFIQQGKDSKLSYTREGTEFVTKLRAMGYQFSFLPEEGADA